MFYFCYIVFIGNEETFYQHTKDFPELPFIVSPDPKKHSLYEKAQKFHKMWYSSNIMNLAVLGKGIEADAEGHSRDSMTAKDR